MQSRWYAIAQAAAGRLITVSSAASCTWKLNPPLPLNLVQLDNSRMLFMLHRGDRVLDQPGHEREKRRMRFVVGAVAMTANSLGDADTLHFAARQALRGDVWRAALSAVADVGRVAEVELEPELKDIAVEGSVLMSAFEVDYYQTYEAA